MDLDVARTRLTTERTEVARLLSENETAAADAVDDLDSGDSADPAQPLVTQGVDRAVSESLTDRLAAVDRALARIDDGTYGVSVRSGDAIPDERLDADPAAELTVAEAAADETAAR